MQALTAPLRDLASFEEIRDLIQKKKGSAALTGCVESQKLHMAYGLGEGYKCKLFVTFSDQKARELCEEYRFYDRNAYFYPAKDLIFFQADIHSNDLITERIKVLRRLTERRPVTIFTTFSALMTPQVTWDAEKDTIFLDKRSEVDIPMLCSKLVELGYEKNYQVEMPGQFSVRGGIIDIFDVTEENPYRIELWGNDVDSLRSFDLLSQRSVESLESLRIYPASEFVLSWDELRKGFDRLQKEADERVEKLRGEFRTEEAHRLSQRIKELKEKTLEFDSREGLEGYIRYFYDESRATSLLSMLGENSIVFLDEPARIREHADAVELEFRESMSGRVEKGYILPGEMDVLYSTEQVSAAITRKGFVAFSAIDLKNPVVKADGNFDIGAKSVAPYNNSFEALVKDLKKYKKAGYRVLLLSGSRTRAQRLAQDLRDEELTAVYTQNPEREILPGEVVTYYGHVKRGFEYPLIKFVVISETDIFGAEPKKKKRKPRFEGTAIKDFNDLKPGDYVVHETHGLGVYRGIEKVESEKVIKDYLKIEYREGGVLYVSVSGLDVIQKYASSDAEKTPKLNKLGTQEWVKTKTKVRTSVEAVAKDLVELYAARQQAEGFRYGQDTVWQREFEEMFPYQETEDQLTAIEETKADMESGKVMDRLICGDVGYGKTEIAIRAAFKAVQEGKQVVYLVPTTILAQQHYNTFVQRMKDFAVRVDLLCRFRSSAEQKKTVTDLKKGLVDIVIGTHRVLSSDVEFKDLGLLIIDEEQRFGVTHKDKIKKLRENLDVLTLTATPIPRTLHMSLVGIRDMSLLEEAPEDRLPIQTYVMEYNEEMVREAISRELARQGQVYYVYNKVHDIADVTARIRNMLPDAVVEYAHGQMKEQELERIMYGFINGEIDVLVATTIVETGLDISNVNTIIIHDSDTMGLSQLYQLRGRVGRSGRNAYAFLMYRKDKLISEVAEKRLNAIREFTELGSGFKIAMRDLEIRGAGNLLGRLQHGHMEAVGYELYCKMLNDAVLAQKGIAVSPDFTTSVELDCDAYISSEYIVNETQKLDIYKRIAGIETEHEKEDMRDELLDRFGTVPKSVDNLLRVAILRVKSHELGITEIRGKNEKIVVSMRPDADIDPAGIPALLAEYGEKLAFDHYGPPKFTLKYHKIGVLENDEETVLAESEKLITAMTRLLKEKGV